MPGARGPVPVPLKENGRDLTQQILDVLDEKNSFASELQFPDVGPIPLKAAIDRLSSRQLISYETNNAENIVLEKEGTEIASNGSHEYIVWKAVKEAGRVAIKELATVAGNSAKFGQGGAMKNKWVRKDGGDLVAVEQEVEDETKNLLLSIQETKRCNPKLLADLKKRKLVRVEKAQTYKVQKGPKFAKEMPVEHTDLTADMLADGSWESASYKPYNFNALGASQSPGSLHPLNKVRSEFRQIFFNQGFVEMPTARYVDSGFWNFDALFVPQQHPARDMQDTFFIKDPARADRPRADSVAETAMTAMEQGAKELYALPNPTEPKPRNYEEYWNRVKAVHEGDAEGSIGYRYKWSEDESLRLVLRTHTTAVSTWCLHRLAEDPKPARYFSIDRVFRNEAVDATHLAEFHQVEGVIADFGLTLGGLMKFLSDFFAKLGITGLRFKPAYNPYTEPSMEIFGFHRGLDKWIEIGNSGMFRPEMLLPMGLPENLRVYGFGLSLERPTMMRYGVNNIRELLGHKVDLKFVEEQPAVRFEKE
ncbi:phenylalanyl-tRNA synthetase-like protein alpha chain [Venturia nashicola]|uniref:phenylalanine--tRNA ligase n=1 Tax=Venturia nashicola TaxID=86259 RepID=A0A4Z1PE21_9PEZI|nr:phenylalanyl-tRNA synthetase-like protein alpha chain [Venturia nashicola]TLD30066.1 phenylalanyl-tRNA synthetase-like protein alpha chain [Venturia nashicola]